MPNWCITSVVFKGEKDNIKRLVNDIRKTIEWSHQNPYYCNMRYFMHISNFDTVSYIQRYPDYYLAPNFRGNIIGSSLECEECDDGEYKYYATLEMAWNTDYEILQLISTFYNVKYSAYSEECGMGIFTTCSNGLVDDYDYNFIISPDFNQFEDFQEENDYKLDLDYHNPVKNCSDEANEIIDTLRMYNINFGIEPIKRVYRPKVYGVYEHYIYGIDYDEDNLWNNNYPGLDRFNRYFIPGIIYDKDE